MIDLLLWFQDLFRLIAEDPIAAEAYAVEYEMEEWWAA